jgi:NAD+ kinase
MMKKIKTIGFFTKYRGNDLISTLNSLTAYLSSKKYAVLIEKELALCLTDCAYSTEDRETIGEKCDLLIVIGGDGSMLNAARTAANCNVPILGINRGKLGFLADIKPTDMEREITEILKGEYIEEKRFLLETEICSSNNTTPIQACSALNEVVLRSSNTAAMLEFEVYIDNRFMCSYRSDGLIITTPTGSTAYSLSGGGSILHPSLNAIALVPMFPHTLTNRPIVIHGDSEIKIVIPELNQSKPKISCDSHVHLDVHSHDTILIRKLKKELRLIHPKNYDYFNALRSKLHWGRKLPD